jgi:hypothetical protein
MGSGALPPHQVTRTTSTLLHCNNSVPRGIGEGFDIILVVMEISSGGNDKKNKAGGACDRDARSLATVNLEVVLPTHARKTRRVYRGS